MSRSEPHGGRVGGGAGRPDRRTRMLPRRDRAVRPRVLGWPQTSSGEAWRRVQRGSGVPMAYLEPAIRLVASSEGGSPGRTRTSDPAVNSRLLYQLSYRGSRRLIYQSATAANKSPFARHASCREPESRRQWCARVAKVCAVGPSCALAQIFDMVRICTRRRGTPVTRPALAWSHCPSGLRNVTNERALPARLDSDAGLDKDRASRADRATGVQRR